MTTPDPKTLQLRLGEALTRLRESHSLTGIEVAHRMGTTDLEISRWERGEASPAAHELWAYLLAVDSSFGDLGYEVDPRPESPRLKEIVRELDSLAREEGA